MSSVSFFMEISFFFYTFAIHLIINVKKEILNYKDLFQKVISLLSAPGKAWDEIEQRSEGRAVMTSFVYPLIGLCGLSEFVGSFIGKDLDPELFQVALTRCCAVAVALFGGFFLAVYLLEKLGEHWLVRFESHERMMVFVGYSLVVTFVLDIISGLFSIAVLHWILQVYTLFIVFEGARRLMKVEESRLTGYTVIATIIILLCPTLIEFIFNKLSVILN